MSAPIGGTLPLQAPRVLGGECQVVRSSLSGLASSAQVAGRDSDAHAQRRLGHRRCPRLVLDRLQDAGNVGRHACEARRPLAFGKCWPSRVRPRSGRPRCCVQAWGLTSGCSLHERLEHRTMCWPCDLPHGGHQFVCGGRRLASTRRFPTSLRLGAWAMKVKGSVEALLDRCALTVRIPQPGGEESLNVATAAAICLYEAARRPDVIRHTRTASYGHCDLRPLSPCECCKSVPNWCRSLKRAVWPM